MIIGQHHVTHPSRPNLAVAGRLLGVSLPLASLLLASLLLASLGVAAPAWAKGCPKPQPRQRLVLAPLLTTPRQAPTAAYRRFAGLLSSALSRSRRFRLLDSPASFAQLGSEGRRLRPRYWSKLPWGTRLIKLVPQRDGARLLLFDPRKRSPIWRWRGRVIAPRVDRWRHLAQRLVDRLMVRFYGRRGYFSTRLAFVRGAGKRSRVLVMDYDGGHLHAVSPGGKESVLPSWSPRHELTYTSYLWRNPDLYIVRKGRSYRLSRQPGLNTGASFSPSGDELALTLSRDRNAEIYVIGKRRGKIKRRLTRSPGIDTSPSWSADGQQIAFVSTRGGSPQLWVIPAAGGTPRQLTTQGNYNQEPAFSPIKGSSSIAFTHQREGGGYDIWLIDAKTRAKRRLTTRGSNKSPSWSPDGKLILYNSSLGGLWAVRADGSCPRRIYGGQGRTPVWSGF
jgi:TolB protein